MLVQHEIPIEDEIAQFDPRPDPKKKRGNPERLAQVQVVSYLRRALPDGSIVFAIPNEQKASGPGKFAGARFGQARKAAGVLTGMPDVCCVVPGRVTVWIEMKSKVGRATDAQLAMHERLRRAGHVVGIVRSIEDAAALMDRAGVPLRFRVSG
ncbi:VRR-NUC domain-containing protein [Pseudoroseomonas cervicalis]|uniref:VRR-NUC domain-containing protein n=1 Tax=Teichococcus cervicalis TaxID=204525 RepID=UPI00278B0904|nr:VRR-NUC domain-containing protein [Pseudoroseomonas cervicalis]MDQ1077986.1 hypothetical protein [Pseudoroseomonas cervicalis]